MKELISLSCYLIVAFSLLVYAIHDAINTPCVYKSWSTQECKYIQYADGTITNCDKLEQIKTYDLVWVE
jgi:hypothetical protein